MGGGERVFGNFAATPHADGMEERREASSPRAAGGQRERVAPVLEQLGRLILGQQGHVAPVLGNRGHLGLVRDRLGCT